MKRQQEPNTLGGNEQTTQWAGEFGKQYTDRNALSPDELDSEYRKRYGVTRTEMNGLLLNEIDPPSSILEVGCNVGNQLVLLQKMGWRELYGIELQNYALKLLRSRSRTIEVAQGTVSQIPCRSERFDLVFSSGLLIHVHPNDIEAALRELYRCSSRYISGFEYYADEYSEVSYRGHRSLLWKADFARMYLEEFRDLKLIKEMRFKNADNPSNLDSMFLLEKKPK